jgi:acyl-CoA synthetase (NDP forming)
MAPLPCFPFPERAVAALARITHYAEWRKRPRGIVRRFDDIDGDTVRRIAKSSLAAGRGWLTAADAAAIVGAAGIRLLPFRSVATIDETLAAAREIGYPVTMKGIVPSLRRGTESGATRLALAGDDALREAWSEIQTRLEGRLPEVLLQKMMRDGCDVMIGATEQPTFGHLLFYGIAGAAYDVVPDISYRLHPVTDLDVVDMTQEARCAIERRRHVEMPVAETSVQEAIMRLSALLDVCPEIRELEITPLRVTESGVVALDARVRIGAQEVNGTARRVAY